LENPWLLGTTILGNTQMVFVDEVKKQLQETEYCKVFQILTKYDQQTVDWRLNAWCFSHVQHTIGTFRKYSPFSYPPQQEMKLSITGFLTIS